MRQEATNDKIIDVLLFLAQGTRPLQRGQYRMVILDPGRITDRFIVLMHPFTIGLVSPFGIGSPLEHL